MKYNYFYYGNPISKKVFLSVVPENWENYVEDGEYSWGYYDAKKIDHESNNTLMEKQISFISSSLIINIAPGVEGKMIYINTDTGTYYTNNSFQITDDGIIGNFIID
jgi:hypothetical protein